jgi:NADH:ubiquinone oxidoreductase subunit 6 (subunit J)
MIIIDLLMVFLFAIILTSVVTWGFGWRHPAGSETVGASVLFLFVILMLAMWAGGAWLPPWGPVWNGTSWLNLLMIGLLVSLLILAVTAPKRRPRSPQEAAEQAEESAVVGTVFGIFFWILFMGLLVAALVQYFV